MSAQRLKNLGIGLTLCGIALLIYNVFNYEPAFSAIGSRGSYYATEAKIGIAAGAVLILAGVFSYIEGWKKAASD
jgi:uncharacterized membrane protein YidH (DUF202 family)